MRYSAGAKYHANLVGLVLLYVARAGSGQQTPYLHAPSVTRVRNEPGLLGRSCG